jgi:hypothetical protein
MDNSIFSNPGLEIPVEPITSSESEFPIIPPANFNDARSQYEAAKTLLSELNTYKTAVTNAKTLLTSGDSCTAVDVIFTVTAQPPRGKLALQLFEDAKKLQQDCMILCAQKLAKVGGYQNARAILQPYAEENERFKQELEKILTRQNKEMEEKARQKKTIMDDIKNDDRRWSTLGIVSSILSGLLLVAGVIAAFLGQLSAGIVSSVSAILPGLVVALYYNRSDKIRSDRLRLIEKTTGEEQLDLEVVRKAAGLVDSKSRNQPTVEKE